MELPDFVKTMGDSMAARASKHSKLSKSGDPKGELTKVGKFMKSVAKRLGAQEGNLNKIATRLGERHTINQTVSKALGSGAGAKIGKPGERAERRNECVTYLKGDECAGVNNRSPKEPVSYGDAKVLVGLLSGSGPDSIATFFTKSGSSDQGEKLKDDKQLKDFLIIHGVPEEIREPLVSVLLGTGTDSKPSNKGLIDKIESYQPEEGDDFETRTNQNSDKTWDQVRLNDVLRDSFPGI